MQELVNQHFKTERIDSSALNRLRAVAKERVHKLRVEAGIEADKSVK
jgi:hypothetical protein